MKIVAQEAIDLIRIDASNGIFQNNTGPHQYGSHGDTKGRSPQKLGKYSDYKASGMRRIRDNKKLKGFSAKPTDTDTAHVNMNLTGRTLRGMRAGARKNVAIIRYDKSAIVLGNARRSPDGYDIFDLNDKNQTIIANRIADILARTNIKKYVAKREVMK